MSDLTAKLGDALFDLADECGRLKAINAELLAVCEELASLHRPWPLQPGELSPTRPIVVLAKAQYERLAAAVAKAKGA